MMQAYKHAAQIANDNAPYLRESLTLFPDCAASLGDIGPDIYVQNLIETLPEAIGDMADEMALLRVFKRHAHLAIALSDIAQIWDWSAVTEALSTVADIAMHRLLRSIARAQNIDGTADNPIPGLFVLAVGKYGARELNYSSDIDFSVFYDPDVIALPNMARAERTLIKLVQSLIAGLERITAEGYIFRTDLRLRPDPRSNAVAVSTRTAERYYETIGQNWERAAMIKARICGGDQDVGAAFISDVLTPFIWRRSLDYAAIEDIQAIKRQIHTTKANTHIKVAGHHLKLGYGGIREIEFYAQTQQLILGGRRPELRAMRTVTALRALADAEAVAPDTATSLISDYAVLRKCEHAAQMIDDAQTHTAPADDTARAALAALVGYDNVSDFDAALLALLRRVHDHYTRLFPQAESLSLPEGSLAFTGVEAGPATLKTLSRLGFTDGPAVWSDMAAWLGGRIAATRTERARELLTRLAPQLMKICSETGRADDAFHVFRLFFTAQRSGVNLLSMFVNAPKRLSDIITLMLRSSRIADMIAGNPAILDAMIDPRFLHIDLTALGQNYSDSAAVGDDFEDQMNLMRRALHEDQFRVNAAVLSGQYPLAETGAALSVLADATVASMLPAAAAEVARLKAGLDGDYAVIAMGKAGGRELSLASDLDVMMLYQPRGDDPNTHGQSAHRQFSKLTQRFVTAVSSITAEGRLYDIDMALRPSGRSGPVAVSLTAFKRYYREKAWVWEFMALSRARVMAASSADFAAMIDKAITQALCVPRPDLDFPVDVADMLRRLRGEKGSRGVWDVKQCEGGLRDIEFIAQALLLERRDNLEARRPISTMDMLRAAHDRGNMAADDFETLRGAALFYQNVTQAFTLTRGSITGSVNPYEVRAMAAVMDVPPADITDMRDSHCAAVLGILPRYIPL